MRSKIRALVLEDTWEDFIFLKEVLVSCEDVEIEVVQATRLEEGLKAARAQIPDVVILDLYLPDSSGLDTFTDFHQQHPQCPVVILSDDKTRERGLQAVSKGAQDYLYKGEASATAIIRTVRYAIERQRLKTKLQRVLFQVKQLQGLLPICSICKKIRDDEGYWNSIEAYLSDRSDASFTHSICPACEKNHHADSTLDT